MSHLSVSATRRTETGKGAARESRRQGLIPGVLYGLGKESLSFNITPRQIVDVIRSEKGVNSIIDFDLDGDKRQVLLQDYQIDPLKRTLVHVDMLELTPGRKVVASVPIDFQGKTAVNKAGNQERTMVHSIKVRCLPEQIPSAITLDLSKMELNRNFLVTDLELPEGIEAVYKHNFAIAYVKLALVEAVAEEEEEAVVAAEPVAE